MIDWLGSLYLQFSSMNELEQFKFISNHLFIYAGAVTGLLVYLSSQIKKNLFLFSLTALSIVYGIFITISGVYIFLDFRKNLSHAKSIIDSKTSREICKVLFHNSSCGDLGGREYNYITNEWEDKYDTKPSLSDILNKNIGCGFVYLPQVKKIVFRLDGKYLDTLDVLTDNRSNVYDELGKIEGFAQWPDFGEKGENNYIEGGINSPWGARLIAAESGVNFHGTNNPESLGVEGNISLLNKDIAQLYNQVEYNCNIVVMTSATE